MAIPLNQGAPQPQDPTIVAAITALLAGATAPAWVFQAFGLTPITASVDDLVGLDSSTTGDAVIVTDDIPYPDHWWTFDESSGVGFDYGTVSGILATLATRETSSLPNVISGNAAAASLTNDAISYAGNPLGAIFTFMCWVKWSAHASTQIPLFCGTAGTTPFRVYLDTSASNKLKAGLGKAVSVVTSGGGVSSGTWHHIALTCNTGTKAIALYIDGTADGTGTYTGTLNPSNSYVTGLDQYSESFTGYVDDVRVYLSALTAQEISDVANQGASPPPPPPPPPPPTPGATCADAAALTNGTTYTETITNIGDAHWWTYTAPTTGTYTVTSSSTTQSPTVFIYKNGSCPSPTLYFVRTPINNTTQTTPVSATAGDVIRIKVSDASNANSYYTLEIGGP